MRRFFFTWLSLAGVLLMTPVSRGQSAVTEYGSDLSGQPVRRLASAGTDAVVLFFAATDCPISNRYIPEMRRIEEEFVAQHVVLWFVYPNFGETPEAVRRHIAEYGTEQHVLLDPDHRLVALTHVKATPESAILVPEVDGTLREVYHGRIDDRYVRIGLERPKATQHDLERAIDDVLHHRAVEQADGPAVGCGIIGHP